MNKLIAAALVAFCGCASSGLRTFQDKNMDFGSIKTVAVLPFTNLGRDNLAGDRVREVFSNMLLASGAVYVLPQGEVMRGVARVGLGSPSAPSVEEVIKLGTALKAEAVITGVVNEYGETRSGSASANQVSVSVHMFETGTGRQIWTATSSKGGVTFGNRLIGSSGPPFNQVTEAVCDELLANLFK